MGSKRQIEASRLLGFQLFAGLAEEQIAEIAQACEELVIGPEFVIVRQGQIGDEIYLMESGSVKVYREIRGREEPIVTLQAPNVFGEMALVNPERVRTASVEALTELYLLSIPLVRVRDFLKRFPALKSNLQELLRQRGVR